MGTVIKVLVALVIGAGILHFAQQMFLTSMKSQIATAQAPEWFTETPQLPTPKFDKDAFNRELREGTGPIDTKSFERAAVLSTGRQADIARRNAESLVPLH